MKKLLAAGIVIFVLFMSYVFIGGFLDKQNKSNTQTNTTDQTQQVGEKTKTSNSNTISTYTTSEVSSHSSPEDCWLIINNNIYGVTDFLRQHPGGASTITPYCGKDATQAFATQDKGSSGGHSNSAKNMLTNYQIGTLKQ